MRYRIKLADEDRARYEGCPEWLSWDTEKLSIDEAIEIQERAGVAPGKWAAALSDPSAVVWKLVVWICLNRAGLQIGWTDVHFDWVALESVEDAEGKEPSSTPAPPSEAGSEA